MNPTPRQTDHLRRSAIVAADDTDTPTQPALFHGGPLDRLTLSVTPGAWAWWLWCFGAFEGGLQMMTYHREFDGF